MNIRVIWALIFFVFLYIGALSLGEKGGRTAVGSQADSRLGVKGYGAWMNGWTPYLSPVVLLIFMFLVFSPLGDLPDHWLKLFFIVNMVKKKNEVN